MKFFVYCLVFVVFCFVSWFAVEKSINKELQQQVADQAKQIEGSKKELSDVQGKIDCFRSQLVKMLPDKVEVVQATYVGVFGPSQPAQVTKSK